MKRRLSGMIWLAVALAALAVLGWRIFREGDARAGFVETLRGLDWWWAAAAAVCWFAAQTLLGWRWTILLKAEGIRIALFKAIQLTWLGLFYNNLMPGAVGGDLLKAWYVTHHGGREQRVEAALTVFVDRLLGLFALVVLALGATALLGVSERAMEVTEATARIQKGLLTLGGVMVLVVVVLLSRRLRTALQVDRIIAALPWSDKLSRLDEAIRLYRHHRGAAARSLGAAVIVQGVSIASIWMLAQALGFAQVSLLECVVVMPIVWTVSAAVALPGGLGVAEYGITYLFPLVSSLSQPEAFTLSLFIRVMLGVTSLPGALVPVLGLHVPKVDELEQGLEGEKGLKGA